MSAYLPDIGAYEYQEAHVAIKKSFFIALEVTAAPDFFPASVPDNMSVSQGVVATFNVTISPVNGFAKPVLVTPKGLPAGFVPTFDVNPIPVGGSAVLTIATKAAPLGLANLEFEAEEVV